MLAADQRLGIERRHSPRLPMQEHGTIAFHGQRLPCNLVDESDHGVRLANLPVASCPDEFELHLEGSEARQCRVAWRSSIVLGVRYREDQRLRRLRHTIGRYERLLIAGADADMAAIYRAEIDAAQTMMQTLQAQQDRRQGH